MSEHSVSGIDWVALAASSGVFLAVPAFTAGVGISTEMSSTLDTTSYNVVLDDLGSAYEHLHPQTIDIPLEINGQFYAPPISEQPQPFEAIVDLRAAGSNIREIEVVLPENCSEETAIATVEHEVAGFEPNRRNYGDAESCILELADAIEAAKADFVNEHEPEPKPRDYYVAAAAFLAIELSVVGLAMSTS